MHAAPAVAEPRKTPSRARDGLTNATRVMREDQLTRRHRLMIDYMVHGVSHPTLLARLPLRYVPIGVDKDGAPLQKLDRPGVHEALTLEDAAAACNVRPRVARQLSKQRVFQRLLAEETAAFRDGAKARAWRRIDALAHDPGAGSAADRKVMLGASQVIIGEQDGTRGGTTVNVFNGSTKIEAGVVIRLPPSAQRAPLEQPGPTVEHEDA